MLILKAADWMTWKHYIALLDSPGHHRAMANTDVLRSDLAAESESLKESWTAYALSKEEDMVLSRYFVFCQRQIGAIADQLLAYSDDAVPVLLGHLDELLGFLETYFPEYLQVDMKYPEKWIRKHRAKIVKSNPARTGFSTIALGISVAQLACLLRIAYEQGFFPGSTVSELIRLAAAGLQTKRRLTISSNGLAKEYYSVTQATAAVCRGYLEQMIKQINRQFFP